MQACIVDGCSRKVNKYVYCGMHQKRLERNGTTRKLTTADWFFRHVTLAESGCWEFSPLNLDTGYPNFTIDKGTKCVRAHRWSYEYFVADIPDNLEIDHLCRNPPCVNPWHLEPVTRVVNAQRGVGSRETCVNGHPYDASNTEIHSRGHRQCRTCRQTRERRFGLRHLSTA